VIKFVKKYRLARLSFILIVVAFLSTSLFPTHILSSSNSKLTDATSTFQAGHIIDDNIFINDNALSAAQIQTFLNDMISSVGGCYSPGSHPGSSPNGACINEYCENTSTLQNNFSSASTCSNGEISAAQIIYDAAQQYDINPEVLLVTMQKEQGLVTDNWPWYDEYQSAMGYSCPDSSGCSSSYADFYQQVDGAAWQFRDYLNNPGAFDYWIGSNNIDYAPGCGGSTVDIQNAATAALYIYTPYQPDSNVLANTNPIGSSSGAGPAISDHCAAYGNRNFWWYFNTWFGPSIDTNVSIGEETGTNTYYVLYDGQKQGIPSQDVLDAWGLNGLPVTSLDSAVFNSIPTASTILSRYSVNTQNGQAYFADNGNLFSVSANDASVWNFSSQSQAQVSSDLINFSNYQGEIKSYVYVSGSPTIYAVDDGAVHGIPSSNLYELWAGPNYSAMQLSSSYFNTMTSGSTIQSPEFTYGGQTFVASDDVAYGLTSATQSLVPSSWTPIAIQQGLLNTFSTGGNLKYMVQGSSQTVYLLDAGTLRGIPNGEVYSAFQSNGSLSTSYVSSAFLADIPSGSVVSGNLIKDNNNYYTVYNGLHLLSSELITAYNASNNALPFQTNYTAILPSGSPATRFVNEPGSQAIFYVDSGDKLPFSNPAAYTLVGGGAVTNLTSAVLNQLSTGTVMSNYVSNGGVNYLLDGTNAYTVSNSNVAQAWGLNSPVAISSQAIADYTAAGQLTQNIQIPDGHFCLVDSRNYYCAEDPQTLANWQLNVGAIKPSQQLVSYLLNQAQPLSSFIMGKSGQQFANTVFTVAGGSLFGIRTIDNAFNLGYTGTSIQLDQTTISSLLSSQPWQGYLATDSSGNLWVLDGGVKREVPSSISAAWETNQTPTELGGSYLSSIPTATSISNSIRTQTNPTVYGMNGGEKYGISSLAVYNSSGLSPYTVVSDSLANSIPSGGIWP